MIKKFRAWDRATKTMILDYAHQGAYGELYVTGFHWSAYSDESCPDLILMQFTGLRDRKKIDVYEGDIAEQESIMDYPGHGGQIDFLYTGEVVILASKGACLKRPLVIDRLEEDRKWRCDYNKNLVSYRSKIIGNVYENPELLV